MSEEFLVYKFGKANIRTVRLSTGEITTLKTVFSLEIFELHTVSFNIRKEWSYDNNKYASGDIVDYKFVENNIKTEGLTLQNEELWDPVEEYGDDAEKCCPEYIREGLRHSFVFADYTGFEFYGPETDPISDAVDAMESGDSKKAYRILTRLLEEYPECIDALAHLASMYFDFEYKLKRALHCYWTAIYLAEKKFPKNFDGLILWSRLKNRPYLRALCGYCVTNWRLKNFSEAQKTAKKLLRLNPPDNQGVRFYLNKIQKREEWHEDI
jgi:tetratricopeptide (TPR) repeat protein